MGIFRGEGAGDGQTLGQQLRGSFSNLFIDQLSSWLIHIERVTVTKVDFILIRKDAHECASL